jgi:hypothetical protein
MKTGEIFLMSFVWWQKTDNRMKTGELLK